MYARVRTLGPVAMLALLALALVLLCFVAVKDTGATKKEAQVWVDSLNANIVRGARSREAHEARVESLLVRYLKEKKP